MSCWHLLSGISGCQIRKLDIQDIQHQLLSLSITSPMPNLIKLPSEILTTKLDTTTTLKNKTRNTPSLMIQFLILQRKNWSEPSIWARIKLMIKLQLLKLKKDTKKLKRNHSKKWMSLTISISLKNPSLSKIENQSLILWESNSLNGINKIKRNHGWTVWMIFTTQKFISIILMTWVAMMPLWDNSSLISNGIWNN